MLKDYYSELVQSECLICIGPITADMLEPLNIGASSSSQAIFLVSYESYCTVLETVWL